MSTSNDSDDETHALEQCDVIVLGAGPAGIAAARHLTLTTDLSVVVVEARGRVGGRTHTSDELGVGLPLDHGGKWVHGSCPANPMVKLIKERGEEKECRKETERRTSRRNLTRLVLPVRGGGDDENAAEEERFMAVEPSKQCWKACNKVFTKIRKLAERGDVDEDLPLEDLLYRTYADCVPHGEGMEGSSCQRQFYYNLVKKILSDNPGIKNHEDAADAEEEFLDETMALLNMKICDFFEAHEGTPIHQISSKHGLDGTELSGKDLNVPFGYGELVRRLAQPLVDDGIVRLGHRVVSVETPLLPGGQGKPDDARVTVRCVQNDDGVEKSFRASSCVVALPLGVLRRGLDPNSDDGPAFRPPLPEPVTDAISALGICVMNKLELSFDRRWWPPGHEWLDIGSSLSDRSPTYHPFALFLVESESTPSKPDAPNVLVCYLTGEFAKRAEGWDDDEIRGRCMEAIRRADFPAVRGSPSSSAGEDVPDPTRVHMTRWHSDPYSGGSWTFLATNSGLHSMRAIKADEGCIKRGLFFAGEHTCDGAQPGLDIGSVHGAWLSGEVAAKMAKKSLSQCNLQGRER